MPSLQTARATPSPTCPASDFTLQDNGQPVPLLRVSSRQHRSHRSLIIVIDAVNSTYTQVSFQRSQLQHFLTGSGGKLPYACVHRHCRGYIAFRSTPGFTTDGNALNAALQQQTVALARPAPQCRRLWRGRAARHLPRSPRQGPRLSPAARPATSSFSSSLPVGRCSPARASSFPAKRSPGSTRRWNASPMRNSGQRQHAVQRQSHRVGRKPGARGLSTSSSLKASTSHPESQLGNLGLQVLAVQSGGLSHQWQQRHCKAMLQQCVDDAAAPYTLTFTPYICGTRQRLPPTRSPRVRPVPTSRPAPPPASTSPQPK